MHHPGPWPKTTTGTLTAAFAQVVEVHILAARRWCIHARVEFNSESGGTFESREKHFSHRLLPGKGVTVGHPVALNKCWGVPPGPGVLFWGLYGPVGGLGMGSFRLADVYVCIYDGVCVYQW